MMQNFVQTEDAESFWNALADQLRTSNKQFGILQKGLRSFCFKEVKV